MWRWFPQQRQSFLANQVVLSGRRRAQGIASRGRTKSLQPSLNLWWCWTRGELPKRLHLFSWFTQKVPHQCFTSLWQLFYFICTMQVKISLYIGYLVFVLFIWIQLYSGWLVFGAHFATVGLRIVRWTFQVYCARVVYLEHIVQELICAFYIWSTLYKSWSLPCIFGAHCTRGCAREKTRSSRRLLCRPSGHGQTGGVQRRLLF